MSQKASKTPAPDDANSKPRQRLRSGLVAWGADLKAGKSSGRSIWPTYEEAVEEDARDRALFLDELHVHSEEYDRLTRTQKLEMRDRWAKKYLEKLQQAGKQTAIQHFTSDARKAIADVWNSLDRPSRLNYNDIIEELDTRGVEVPFRKKYKSWDEAWRKHKRHTRRYISTVIRALRNEVPKGLQKGSEGSKAKKVQSFLARDAASLAAFANPKIF